MLINHYPVDWKEVLHTSLLDCADNIYVLVDGVHNESFYRTLKNINCFRYLALYSSAPSADEETLGLGPILVQYTTEHRKQWDALMEMTNGHPALSIIVSPESLEQLAERLIPWCVVDADSYALALSFADTRILPSLVGTLEPRQRGQFFGPALTWSCPGRDACWVTLPLDPEQALAPAKEVTLTAEQVSVLMAASEADSIAYQLSQYVTKPLSGYTPFDGHVMIADWLALADQLKIEVNRDRFALCEFGLGRPDLVGGARYLALRESGAAPCTLEEARAFLLADHNNLSTT